MRGGFKRPASTLRYKMTHWDEISWTETSWLLLYGFLASYGEEKKLNFLGETPRSGPLKILKLQNFQKVTPMTSYNPIFLLQNRLVLSKLGWLQKTRAQKIKIWTNGGYFCDDKEFLWSPRLIFKKFISRPFLEIFLISFLILAIWA